MTQHPPLEDNTIAFGRCCVSSQFYGILLQSHPSVSRVTNVRFRESAICFNKAIETGLMRLTLLSRLSDNGDR